MFDRFMHLFIPLAECLWHFLTLGSLSDHARQNAQFVSKQFREDNSERLHEGLAFLNSYGVWSGPAAQGRNGYYKWD